MASPHQAFGDLLAQGWTEYPHPDTGGSWWHHEASNACVYEHPDTLSLACLFPGVFGLLAPALVPEENTEPTAAQAMNSTYRTLESHRIPKRTLQKD